MRNVVPLSEADRSHYGRELDPRSRVALIMANVERLAEEASCAAAGAEDLAGLVRGIISARAARRRFFGDELFADPAWDILLELYTFRSSQQRTSVSKLCLTAGVPTTTALRWIEKLHSDGLVERQPDPLDGRRVWISLSERGYEAMTSYLEAIGENRG